MEEPSAMEGQGTHTELPSGTQKKEALESSFNDFEVLEVTVDGGRLLESQRLAAGRAWLEWVGGKQVPANMRILRKVIATTP